MPEPGTGESFLERLRQGIIIVFNMSIPPVLSLERMEATCKKLIARSPKALMPRSFLADIYRLYNRNEAAYLEYEELCGLAPLDSRDKIRFAEVLFRLKKFDRVIEVSEEVVAKRPNDKNATWRFAMSLMEMGQYGRAATFFQRSITAGNRRFEDFWRLGFCLVKAGLLEQALKAYQEGLKVNPESTGLKNSVAWVESKLRQASESKLAAGNQMQSNGTPPPPPAW